MLTFHLWFVPMIGAVVLWLLWKKHIRDATLFFALSLVGYGLWINIVNHRPFIITLFIAKIIDAIKIWGY